MAKAEDAPAIAKLLAGFFAASRWSENLNCYEDRTAFYIEKGIAMDVTPHILGFDGDELVSVLSFHTDARYTDPIAVLDEIFVIPRLRRTDLGCRMVILALDLAKNVDGAVIMNFPIASGMPVQRSLINMLIKRFGCEPMGLILRKVL